MKIDIRTLAPIATGEPNKHVIDGYQPLWRAVILQAITDACTQSAKPNEKYHKEQALHWLLSPNEDFIIVCDLAGWNPSFVRLRAKKTLIDKNKRNTDKAVRRKKPERPIEIKSMPSLMPQAQILQFNKARAA